MKQRKISIAGIAGCFAAASLIGNSGCSMMERDYYLDEHGQRHEIDTSSQRTGEFFGSLLMMSPYGLLSGLALKNASSESRRAKVRESQQWYLRQRLYGQNQQPKPSYLNRSTQQSNLFSYSQQTKPAHFNYSASTPFPQHLENQQTPIASEPIRYTYPEEQTESATRPAQ